MSDNSDLNQLSASTSCTTINNDLDKVLYTFAKCEESICQIILCKFIYKHLDDIIDNNVTNDCNNKFDIMLNKLKQIFFTHEIEKYFVLPTQYKQKDNELILLGISNLPMLELNYEEKKILKSTVEKLLLKTINSYLAKYEEHGGNLAEIMKSNESIARQQLLKFNDLDILYWKNKLDEVCKEQCHDIYICRNLLNEWLRLKNEDIEKLNYQKAQTKQLETQITEIQIRMAKLKYSLKMFSETPETLEAFKMLDRKLDEKLIDVQVEIKNKKSLSKQYHDLLGTEYDDVLNKYSDLRTTIKKDERLLNNL